MTDPAGVDEVVRLAEHFRARGRSTGDQHCFRCADLLTAQAARIAELEGERDEALNQKDSIRFDRDEYRKVAQTHYDRALAAEAEAQKLRAERDSVRQHIAELYIERDVARAERDEAVGLLRIISKGNYLQRNEAINHGVPAFIAKHGASV